MSFETLDAAAVARALALVATSPDDVADVYLEERLTAELPAADEMVGFRTRHESGLAARLVRGDRAWLASRDALSGHDLAEALRGVARTLPQTLPEPRSLAPSEPLPEAPFADLAAFPGRLERALRRRLVGFPMRVAVRWHQRTVQVVGLRTTSPAERESFADVEVRLPWGRCGALVARLDDAAAEQLTERLVVRFRAREAAPPAAGHPPIVLQPTAAAVALHECVAHALEADLLARTGNPAAAEGVTLGAAELDVLDDPSSAPPNVARTVDDEGLPVVRRWLLRGGQVVQPIADLRASRRWPELLPGSGFRADRHAPPLPRSHHLEVLGRDLTLERLFALAEGGLLVSEIDAGALDAANGRFELEVAGARRIVAGAAGDTVGRFRLRGRLSDLLGGVVGVGAQREVAGAGWCAKGGQRKAVWATVPALGVVGLEVVG